jgi:hypothetical protein
MNGMENFTVLYMSSVLFTVTSPSPLPLVLRVWCGSGGEFYSLSSALGKYYTHKKQQVGTHIIIVYFLYSQDNRQGKQSIMNKVVVSIIPNSLPLNFLTI